MGDLDLDGDVDIADFGLFKGGFGQTTDWFHGELDFVDSVTIADFGLFKGGFGDPLTRPDPPAGMPPLATSAQVPEPATFLMTLMAVALGGIVAWWRRPVARAA